jgi:hypothetical protein
VTQLVLPLHDCATNPTVAESAEPLHFAADPTDAGAAPTETSCLCVRV